MPTCESSATVECLVELLGDEHTQVRLHGVRKLAQMGPVSRPAVAALCHAARDRSRKVRHAAVQALDGVMLPARKQGWLGWLLAQIGYLIVANH